MTGGAGKRSGWRTRRGPRGPHFGPPLQFYPGWGDKVEGHERGPREPARPGPSVFPHLDYFAFWMSKQTRQVGMFSGSVDPSSTGS
jgi:hypothetical protein